MKMAPRPPSYGMPKPSSVTVEPPPCADLSKLIQASGPAAGRADAVDVFQAASGWMAPSLQRLFPNAVDAALLLLLSALALDGAGGGAARIGSLALLVLGGTLVSALCNRIALVDLEQTCGIPVRRLALRAGLAAAVAALAIAVAAGLLLESGEAPRLAWLLAGFVPLSATAHALTAHAIAFQAAAPMRLALIGHPARFADFEASLARRSGPRALVAARLEGGNDADIERLRHLVLGGQVDVVVLATCGLEAGQLLRLGPALAEAPVRICFLADPLSLDPALEEVLRWSGLGVVEVLPHPGHGLEWTVKRATDVTVSLAALLFMAPLLLLIALAIRLESPGPVLFRQWRAGLGGKPIQMLKFRSMHARACDATGAARTRARDPRVTHVGRFLRRTSLDELPQLWNVLRGDMSLVGPRPHALAMEVEGRPFAEVVNQYRLRHRVRPGITGWAQVNGSRGEVDTLERARQRVALDLWYVDHWSLALDAQVIFRTLLGGFASFRAD